MRVKISVSMDKNTLKKIDLVLKQGFYRNKSHLIEFATLKHIGEVKNGRQ